MASLLYKKGDATKPEELGHKTLIHVCNTTYRWGRGFVLAVSKRWPEPRKVYMQARELNLGDIQIVDVEENFRLVNMIAQVGIHPRNGIQPIRYEALHQCLMKVAKDIRDSGKDTTVVAPRIGCGLAGGSWKKVERLILMELVGSGVDVVIYDYDGEEV